MLSILIPTYNTRCTQLVEDLHSQCKELNIQFEILCYDDKSDIEYLEFNSKINQLSNVIFKQMDTNLGRAKIRNKLAKDSNNNYLLFIDADSGVVSNGFIRNYILLLNENDVIYGGRDYSINKPNDNKKYLHWKYGKEKEALDSLERQKEPFLNFMSNNFTIKKDIFNKIKFDENHTGYGYEDTLFAEEINLKKHKITHVNNPLIHLGLEDNTVFLSKVENAIENLAILYQSNKIMDTRLIKTYKTLNRLGVMSLFHKLILNKKAFIFKNLLSSKPNLKLLQLYKLALFAKLVIDKK